MEYPLYHISLEKIVKSSKGMAEHLIPWTFPISGLQTEHDVMPLKSTRTVVDGYPLVLTFSVADFEEYFLDTLQITSSSAPFLPFNLVVKIAKKFLGTEHLYLLEFVNKGRRVYYWTLFTDEYGKAIENPKQDNYENLNFEGFNYKYIFPKKLNYHHLGF